MKKLMMFLMMAVLPVLFLQQCNNTLSSCTSESLEFDGTFTKCVEAPGLVAADCESDATFLDGQVCDLTLYTKQCDPILGFTFESGTWFLEGAAVYYGGTSTLVDANASTDCLGYGGTVSSL